MAALWLVDLSSSMTTISFSSLDLNRLGSSTGFGGGFSVGGWGLGSGAEGLTEELDAPSVIEDESGVSTFTKLEDKEKLPDPADSAKESPDLGGPGEMGTGASFGSAFEEVTADVAPVDVVKWDLADSDFGVSAGVSPSSVLSSFRVLL